MKRFLTVYLCLTLSPLAVAQLGSQNVPDLSAFAGAIAQSASAAPAPAPVGGAAFESGLTVPSVAPGTAARKIGAQLRTTLEAKAGSNPAFAQLEASMPALLSSVEQQLEKEGFRRHDLGVAMAYTFLINYETANHTKVPDEPSRIAARTVARAIALHWGPVFAQLPDAKKEDMYESLLVSTTLLSAFTQQFEKAGKTAEADSMRNVAGQMFEKLLGVPPSQVTIGADGRISGLATPGLAAPAHGSKATAASIPIPEAAPAAEPASQSATGLRGIWRADWVQNVYGMAGMQLLAQNQTLAFDNEGDFISDLPAGKSLRSEDLRAIVAAASNKGGRYEMAGDQVNLKYASGTTATVAVNRSGAKIVTLRFRGRIMGKKDRSTGRHPSPSELRDGANHLDRPSV